MNRQDATFATRNESQKRSWVKNNHKNIFHSLLGVIGVLVVQPFFAVALAQEGVSAKKDMAWPAIVFCGKKNSLGHVSSKNQLEWECDQEGPVLDVQPQPQEGRYLVTGGEHQVALVRKVWKGCRVLWDWKGLEGVSIVSAVVADWDQDGTPTLILAADALNSRLFLGEAKAKNMKIRWEYKLPAPPRRVRLCPDTGNFLVTLADSTLQEIFFQEDKLAWSLGKGDGLRDVRDAVRGPWANTFTVDAADGTISSFDARKERKWKTKLPFIPSLPVADMALSLFKKNGKRMVLVSADFSRGSGGKPVLYLLNAETGSVLAWKDRLENGKAYPPFLKAVPDLAVYQKKQ